MIPRIYSADTYDFINTNGYGALSDGISCTVTEELNGIYELELEYPVGGTLYDKLEPFNIIGVFVSEDSEKVQAFDIHEVRENGKTAIVTGRHISYRLNYIPCWNLNQCNTIAVFCQKINNLMVFKNATYSTNYRFNFTYDSADVTDALYTETTYSAKELVNKAATRFEKDLLFDNFTVKFMNRHIDRGMTVRRGVNLGDIERVRSADGAYNALTCYWYEKNSPLMMGGSDINTSRLPYPRSYSLDITQDANEADWVPEGAVTPTTPGANYDYLDEEDLHDVANLRSPSYLSDTKVSVDLKAVNEDNSAIQVGETVRVCDTELKIDITATVRERVYDVLQDRTIKISLGAQSVELGRVISNTVSKVESNSKNRIETIFGGRACTTGITTMTYNEDPKASATQMKKVIDTALLTVDTVMATVEYAPSTPYAQVTNVTVRRDYPNAGQCQLIVNGNGFVKNHVLNVMWVAVGYSKE